MGFNSRLKREERLFFTEQMSLLLAAGVSVIPAIDLLRISAKRRVFADFYQSIKQDVQSGVSISTALRKFDRSFSPLYIALIEVGEISGKLPLIFDYLGQMERARLKALKSIQKALIYPIVVLIVAIVVLLFILMVIVPTFELLYQSGGVELPKVTQKVLALSQFLLSRSGMWLLFYLLLLLGGLRFFYRRESGFRYRLDGYVLRMPLIGPILLASFNARFSQVVGMMLGAGIPLVKSIELYSAGLNNQYIQKQLRALIEALKRGDSLYNVAKSSQLFTAVALTLISVGEMSGTLVTVLERSGQYHTDIVMQRVEAFIALIDPLSLLLIGGVVGVILIALYLPLFTLGMAI